MKRSFKRSMGKPLRGKNARAYFDPERFPSCPDEDSLGRLQRRAFTRSLLSLCPLCSQRDELLVLNKLNQLN